MKYEDFLKKKSQMNNYGFEPKWMPDFLYDFQKYLLDWAIQKGRAGIFADCGLGKTPMQLVWAYNVLHKTNKPVLILAPLAVVSQTIEEAEKFGIKIRRHDRDLKLDFKEHDRLKDIVITNYEQLHKLDYTDFSGVVCDESSILKSFDGKLKAEITQFMRKIPYRSLWTATAAPNDYIELGTSSEALGYMGYIDMLNKFFKNDQNNSATGRMYGNQVKWRFKGHAEEPFWKWVSSWAKAIRKPSDFNYDDNGFVLPGLKEESHIIKNTKPAPGMLFNVPPKTLPEQRQENRRTLRERCEKVAELTDTDQPSVIWCNLNSEGDLLEQIILNAVQVAGKHSDKLKEERIKAFKEGEIQKLITKPKIGAFGLNFQHCSHATYFPTHSYEMYYQAVRRFYRFGQPDKVKIDLVTTEGGEMVYKNLLRKSKQAERMFDRLLQYMNNAQDIQKKNKYINQEKLPSWL